MWQPMTEQFAKKNHDHGGGLGCALMIFVVVAAFGGPEWIGRFCHELVRLAETIAADPRFQAGWNAVSK